MFGTILMAVPLALIWMIVTSEVSPGSFGVGMLIGISILLVIGARPTLKRGRLIDQVTAFVVYTITLARDVVNCSIIVARCVLKPEMCINPGILAVDTQDAAEDDVIAAFSAHGITITPGELVLDFDGARTMFVHCLDVEASAQSAPDGQAKRLLLLRRVLGSELA